MKTIFRVILGIARLYIKATIGLWAIVGVSEAFRRSVEHREESAIEGDLKIWEHAKLNFKVFTSQFKFKG